MKNKDRYDLPRLGIEVLWHIDGCGKKTNMKTIQIFYDGELISEEITTKDSLKYFFEWAEREN